MLPEYILIDRDGVINVDLLGDYIKHPDEFRFERGALEGLLELTRAGYRILVVSNQAGVGDGVFTEEALTRVTEKMTAELEGRGIRIEDVFYCLHGKQDGCRCRKPETGLLEEACEKFGFEPARTWFIGDKITDIETRKRFGMKTILVRTGWGERDVEKLTEELMPDKICDDLAHAVQEVTG